MTLDLLDPLLYAGDPGPAYQWLRDEAPVYWDPHSSRSGFCRIHPNSLNSANKRTNPQGHHYII